MSKLLRPEIHRLTEENQSKILERAARILQGGGIIVHPTETVYGLATRWDREQSLRRVAQIKQRNEAQPFSIMVSQVEQIEEIAGPLPPHIHQFLHQLFPAPVTVLLPRQKQVSISYWNQFPYLGFRVPQHAFSRALIAKTGISLITTSANFSGKPAPKTAEEIEEAIRSQVDMVIDGGTIPQGIPSTIVRVSEDWSDLTVVRQGALPLEKILLFFRPFPH